MAKRRGLKKKLISLYVLLVISVSILTGISSYTIQMSVYMAQSEEKLQNTVAYLADVLAEQGDEFIAFQELFLEVSDNVYVPMDYDGDYIDAKNEFYDNFSAEYPGKVIGKDVAYSDLSEELKVLFVTYKHKYLYHIFQSTSKKYDIIYTYYMVPAGDYYMYYILDPVPSSQVIDGTEYMILNDKVPEPIEEHEHMWAAWDTGEFTPGFDEYDNQYGKTYACYYPLWMDGKKMGVVGADIEIATVNKNILENTIQQILYMALLVSVFGGLLTFLLHKFYIERLLKLEKSIEDFAITKDLSIAQKIKNEINGNDEIHDLADETSNMIESICEYVDSLSEANEKIRFANELANKDTLTGIRNKTAYDNEVQKIEFQIAQENFDKFGIAMVDLNYLKLINDNFGHDKGNIAIKKICNIVCVTFKHSPVFRIGGDEFVVILENEDYDNIHTLIKQFRDTLNDISMDETLEPWEKVSAAIGWTMFDKQTDLGVQNVFKRADNLMYEDKKNMKATRD